MGMLDDDLDGLRRAAAQGDLYAERKLREYRNRLVEEAQKPKVLLGSGKKQKTQPYNSDDPEVLRFWANCGNEAAWIKLQQMVECGHANALLSFTRLVQNEHKEAILYFEDMIKKDSTELFLFYSNIIKQGNIDNYYKMLYKFEYENRNIFNYLYNIIIKLSKEGDMYALILLNNIIIEKYDRGARRKLQEILENNCIMNLGIIVQKMINDGYYHIDNAILKSLCYIAEKGDSESVKAIKMMIKKDGNNINLSSYFITLVEISETGNISALSILKQMAEEGYLAPLSALRLLTKRKHTESLSILCQLASNGNYNSLDMIISLLKKRNINILKMLNELSEDGNVYAKTVLQLI